jgi:hypothetical protein
MPPTSCLNQTGGITLAYGRRMTQLGPGCHQLPAKIKQEA